MHDAPTFTLKITPRQRRIIRVQLEAVLYFEGSTGFHLPSLGLDRLSVLSDKLGKGSNEFDACEVWWMDDLVAQLITSREAFGASEWDRHDVDALKDLRDRLERLTL